MNWTVEKLETEPFVRVRVVGAFDPDEHSKMLDDLLSSALWQLGRCVLFDFRATDFVGTNLEIVRRASINRQREDARFGCGKSAFLMKSLTDFARGRQFQMLTEDKVCATLRIFIEEDQALDWLVNETQAESLC